MEYRKQTNGWRTFLEHWGMTLPIVIVVILTPVLSFFRDLTGKPWIYFCAASMLLQVSGAVLILCAKIPVYRSGRFFTFGVKAIPENRARFYRWGWRVFLVGVMLSLCLLLLRP